ncbi:MAG: Arc family DNA-binding protein [Propionibacteriaceae bacterium]|nr:Arc family DNA-binding protein [Propionibacteriaceae bacterium]
MASVITIRNLSNEAKNRVRHRALAHGRSMEAEIRAILEAVTDSEPRGLTAVMAEAHAFFKGEEQFDIPMSLPEYEREIFHT